MYLHVRCGDRVFDTLEGRLETSMVEEGARRLRDHDGQVERKEGGRGVNKREGETRVYLRAFAQRNTDL